jgi:hypothetical protein
MLLLALNRTYFSTFKWMYPVLDSLEVKPVAINERLRATLSAPYESAINEIKQLSAETLDLIHEHYPEIDLTTPRRKLSYQRTGYDNPVHYPSQQSPQDNPNSR